MLYNISTLNKDIQKENEKFMEHEIKEFIWPQDF